MSRLLLSLALLMSSQAAARDLYVDPRQGDEANDGLAATVHGLGRGPVRTIHRAVKYARSGDTIHLAPCDEQYHESVVFHDRICPADKPITLDGHGATITGAESIDLARWEQVAPGRYRRQKLLRVDDAVIGRYFFRFDGKMQHMGRTSKGPSAALKKPKELHSGEWTYVKDEDAFYVQIDPAKKPTDYAIEAPMRSAGVQVSGRNENIIIRNLNTKHVYNDGFNIHNYCRNVVFENVSAVECGDDGISAHDDCRIRVDGFTSIGNSTGFCHTNDSWSDSNRVFIRDCLGFDVFVLDAGKHRLTNSLVLSSAAASVVVIGPRAQAGQPPPAGDCSLDMENVAVVRRGTNEFIKFQGGSIAHVERCTLFGFHVSAAGNELRLRNSIVAGGMDRELIVHPQTKFSAELNLYDLKHLRVGAKYVTRWNYDGEGKTIADLVSQWNRVKLQEPIDGTLAEPHDYAGGVDASKLPSQK